MKFLCDKPKLTRKMGEGFEERQTVSKCLHFTSCPIPQHRQEEREEKKNHPNPDSTSPTKTLKISYAACQAVQEGMGGGVPAHLPAHHQPEGLVGPFHQGNSLPPGTAQCHLIDVHDFVPSLQSGVDHVSFTPFFNLLREMRGHHSELVASLGSVPLF